MEVSDLIQQTDIVEYISQYCTLTERSDGEWWGLSPLKEENTPSFSVNREDQVFYDFSSGQGGDVLAFIRAYNHCSFPCAVSALEHSVYPMVLKSCLSRANASWPPPLPNDFGTIQRSKRRRKLWRLHRTV